ncbi:hypothetical protein [Micromonospora sp. NPDC005171]|uniref:hypothetical protein n=1 Tax=Micromonospora sp. NPDC005171 TaxID=3156866 RepID=UPI0033BE79A5
MAADLGVKAGEAGQAVSVTAFSAAFAPNLVVLLPTDGNAGQAGVDVSASVSVRGCAYRVCGYRTLCRA